MIRLVIEFFRFALEARRHGRNLRERIAIFRTLLSLRLNMIFFKDRNKECRQKILDFEVIGYDYLTLDYLFREIFLSADYYFASNTETPVIIDCGANIGFTVLYFKKILYPQARIYAFEPNPYACTMLKKNISLNGLKDVFVFNVALSNTEGEIPFFLSDNLGSLRASVRADRGGAHELKVKTIRLSDFIEKLGEQIDLVKVDVEGAENQILDDLYGRPKCLAQLNQIILEYHHKLNGEKGQLSTFLKKLEENKFDYNLKSNFTKIGQYQDLLISFYR